jgi:hypothetical protein
MKHRTPRLVGGILIAMALAAASISGAVAKPAPLTRGGENLSPAFVSGSGLAGFHVFATNTGGSNIAQLYLSETTGYDVYAVEATFTPNGGTATDVSAACPQRDQLKCTFGQLRPMDRVDVTVALKMPDSFSNAPIDFEWSTTGFVTGTGNNSHGDAFGTKFTIAGATGDEAGSYVWSGNQTDFANNTTINNGNPQSTSVTVSVTRGPVSLSDGLGQLVCQGLDGHTCPTSFFGEASNLDINNGEVFDPPFRVVITMYRPGVNANQVHGVYHQYTNGTANHEDNIQTTCPATGTPTSECYTATKLGTQNLMLVVYLFHNGRINGW